MSWRRASAGFRRAGSAFPAASGGLVAADVVERVTDVDIDAAGDSISLASSEALVVQVEVDNQTGGPITLTSTPTIAAGQFDGQLLVLFGAAGQLNNVVIQDITALAGSKLRLAAANQKAITARDQVWFRWDAAAVEWWQLTTVCAN